MAAEKLLTIQDRAALEHRTENAIYAERYAGKGPPGIRIGRKLFWRESDWLAWLDSKAEDPRPAA